MNSGLSEKLIEAFPNIVPVPRLLIENQNIKDPNWLSGFTSGEGCFSVELRRSSIYHTGFQVTLVFKLTQHSRDEQLIKSLISYLDCGTVLISREVIYFKVTKFSDLISKVIPFFKKYQIEGVKYKDFED
jgi:hypothetical protein